MNPALLAVIKIVLSVTFRDWKTEFRLYNREMKISISKSYFTFFLLDIINILLANLIDFIVPVNLDLQL